MSFIEHHRRSFNKRQGRETLNRGTIKRETLTIIMTVDK